MATCDAACGRITALAALAPVVAAAVIAGYAIYADRVKPLGTMRMRGSESP